MKQINQLLHITRTIDSLKSILSNGLHTSYTAEKFGTRNILIPMISFSNIQFRDIGPEEVVDYGGYAIGIDRDYGIQNLDLNPVIYVYDNSIIENSIKALVDLSALPNALSLVKEFYQITELPKITEKINFNPLPKEVKNLINTIKSDTDDDLIKSLEVLFGSIAEKVKNQIMLAKPYKVYTKVGATRIAYNEREWRKWFKDLSFIFQTEANGDADSIYQKWSETDKPHLTEDRHTLKIPLQEIKYIMVESEYEIQIMKDFIRGLSDHEIHKFPIIDTQENLKKLEQENLI